MTTGKRLVRQQNDERVRQKSRTVEKRDLTEPSFLERKFARSESVVYRQIAGEALLVPIYTRVEDASSIYSLNEVAAHVWDLADGSRDVGEIRDILVDEFDVSAQVLEEDLTELIQKLLALEVLKEV